MRLERDIRALCQLFLVRESTELEEDSLRQLLLDPLHTKVQGFQMLCSSIAKFQMESNVVAVFILRLTELIRDLVEPEAFAEAAVVKQLSSQKLTADGVRLNQRCPGYFSLILFMFRRATYLFDLEAQRCRKKNEQVLLIDPGASYIHFIWVGGRISQPAIQSILSCILQLDRIWKEPGGNPVKTKKFSGQTGMIILAWKNLRLLG